MCKHLGTVAVVSNQVGAAVESAGDAAACAKRLDAVGDSSRGVEVLENLEVDGKASKVRRSHGGSRDAVGGRVAADPGRQNIDTGAEDVNTSTCQRESVKMLQEGERDLDIP